MSTTLSPNAKVIATINTLKDKTPEEIAAIDYKMFNMVLKSSALYASLPILAAPLLFQPPIALICSAYSGLIAYVMVKTVYYMRMAIPPVKVIYFDDKTGVTSLLVPRMVEGTLFLNIPATATTNIAYHTVLEEAVASRSESFATFPGTKWRYTALIENLFKKTIANMSQTPAAEHPRVPIVLGANVDMDLGEHRLSNTSDFKKLRDQAEYVVPVTTITPYEACAKFETTDFGMVFLKSQKSV